MLMSSFHTMGLTNISSLKLGLLVFFAVLFCGVFGWFTHTVSQKAGFGLILNGVVIFFSLWIGLIAYNAGVRNLRIEAPVIIAVLAVASGIGGFMGLAILRSMARLR